MWCGFGLATANIFQASFLMRCANYARYYDVFFVKSMSAGSLKLLLLIFVLNCSWFLCRVFIPCLVTGGDKV